MAEITVLGAGIAGISAAYHARKAGYNAVLFEARERWGGLLDCFSVEGFRFDHAVHFAFSHNEHFKKVLELTDYIEHETDPYNYERGRWLKHPVQNNLYPLPVEEKVEAIKSFVERPAQTANPNYGEWLKQQFGVVIAERFPAVYTRKYWTVPAEMLSTVWIGQRLYRPSLEEVLFGAMTDQTPVTYYMKKMLYPRRGGFRAFLEPLVQDLEIRTGKQAEYINPAKKYVQFADGSREYYDLLVSSIPLPEIIPMIEGAPAGIKESAATLWATAVAIVSLGFSVPAVTRHLWFYIYDRSILPARAYSPGLKSPDNVPAGCSSLQFEIYYSRYAPLEQEPEAIIEHVIDVVEKMKLASRRDVAVTDFRTLPYGNVVFDHGMVERRDRVRAYLAQTGILSVGRFGEWDYLWSDQCFLSGKQVENVLK